VIFRRLVHIVAPKKAEGEPRTQSDTPKNKGTLRRCKPISWMQLIFILLVLASQTKGQPMKPNEQMTEIEKDNEFYESLLHSISQIKDNSTIVPYKFIASTNSNFILKDEICREWGKKRQFCCIFFTFCRVSSIVLGNLTRNFARSLPKMF
jgi:hypothetical protein